jgi:hypothetical protein
MTERGWEHKPSTSTPEQEAVVDLREPGPLDFSDNPSIPVTATILSLGLLARASRLSYSIRSELPYASWDKSQQTLAELMQAVRDAGWEHANNPVAQKREHTPIFTQVYNNLFKRSRILDKRIFHNRMDEFVQKQERFVLDPKAILHEDIAGVLRPYSSFLRGASENYFIDVFGPSFLESQVVIPDSMVNRDLLLEFTDQEYWRHTVAEAPREPSWTAAKRMVARVGVIAMHQLLQEQNQTPSESSPTL